MKNRMMFFKKTWTLMLALLLLGALSACGAPADEPSTPPEENEPAAGQQEEVSYTTHSTQGVAFQVPADWTQAEGTDLFYATGRPEVYGLNGVSPLGSYEPQEFYKALVEHYEETNQFSDLQAAESVSAWQSADGVDCWAADFTGYQDSVLYCAKLIAAPQKNLVLTFCGQANAETEGDQVCLDTFYAVILHNQRLVTSPEEVREGGNSTLYIGFYLPELEMADLTNCNAGSNTQWTFQEKTV